MHEHFHVHISQDLEVPPGGGSNLACPLYVQGTLSSNNLQQVLGPEPPPLICTCDSHLRTNQSEDVAVQYVGRMVTCLAGTRIHEHSNIHLWGIQHKSKRWLYKTSRMQP